MGGFAGYVLVEGSTEDQSFAITGFPSLGPVAGTTNTFPAGFGEYPWGTGCVVDCSNNAGSPDLGAFASVAVGHWQGDIVQIYNVTDPTNPGSPWSLSTGLGPPNERNPNSPYTGIGVLALSGSNLLVGEYNGPNIVFTNLSQGAGAPPSPYNPGGIGGTAGVDPAAGIFSVALSGTVAVVSGSYGFEVLFFNVPGASNPAVAGVNGKFTSAQWPAACATDGATVAIGDNAGIVYVFTVNPLATSQNGQQSVSFVGSYGTGMGAITSISVVTGNPTLVAAANYNFSSISLITVAPPTFSGVEYPVGTNNQSGAEGGAVRFFGAANLFASSMSNAQVYNLNPLSTPNPTPYGAAPLTLATSHQPTLGVTAIAPQLAGCLTQLLSSPIQLLRRFARRR